MKKLLFLFFLLPTLPVGAQIITYDTIRVSPDDERNIHFNRSRNVRDANAADTNIGNADEPLRRKSAAGRNARGKDAAVFDRSKLRLGANLALSASRNYTNLGFGPQIGYQFNQYFMAGAGVKYYYTRARTYEYEVKNNLLGANLFGYFYPVRFVALFVQPEINYTWSVLRARTGNEKITERGIVPSMVVGAGLRLGRSHITLNYDLVQQANSPHPDGFYLGVSAFF